MCSYSGGTQLLPRCFPMDPLVSQGIVGVQVFLLAITVLLSFTAATRVLGQVAAWISTVLALAAIGLAGAALAPGALVSGPTNTYAVYAAIAFVAAMLNWGALAVIRQYLRARHERHLESPKVRSAA